jgi:iron uptake system EfeUOB component EfeO/EfeM
MIHNLILTHWRNQKVKNMRVLVVMTLAGILVLSGCGQGNTGNGKTSSETQDSASHTVTDADIRQGVSAMLSLAHEFKVEIESGDEAKLKVTGSRLEETWSRFEDGVKVRFPDQYENVETVLDPVVAGSKTSPLDKATLARLDDQLVQVLNTLKAKIP